MKTGPKPIKTWGTDCVVQEVRRRLRILRKKAAPIENELYRSGYQRALDSALDIIRKVMKNDSIKRRKSISISLTRGSHFQMKR